MRRYHKTYFLSATEPSQFSPPTYYYNQWINYCTSQPVSSLLSIHGNYRLGLLFDFVLRPSVRVYL